MSNKLNAVERRYLDLIGLWDSRATSLAPLSEKQKDSIVELNTYVHRPIPKKVIAKFSDFIKMLKGFFILNHFFFQNEVLIFLDTSKLNFFYISKIL